MAISSAHVADTAVGITYIYQLLQPGSFSGDFGLSYYSISVSVNILLNFMIVVRLIRHVKTSRDVIGGRYGKMELYKLVVTVVIESCALYSVTFLLFIRSWAAPSVIRFIPYQILFQIQARAVFTLS
jgi:hypothetical protein